VDDCAVLDVRSLPHAPAPPPMPERIGRILREAFAADRTRHDLTITWPNGERLNVTVSATTTRPFYGGARRWFVCPGQRCGRRCAKLYSPNPGRSPFACRRCWRLVYWSQYLKDARYVMVYRHLIHPPSESASARRQRDRRCRKKLEAMSEEQLLALLEASLTHR
jgi:hypothetical protein